MRNLPTNENAEFIHSSRVYTRRQIEMKIQNRQRKKVRERER